MISKYFAVPSGTYVFVFWRIFLGAFPEAMVLVVDAFKGCCTLQKTASPKVPAHARGGHLVVPSVCPPARPGPPLPGTLGSCGPRCRHPAPHSCWCVGSRLADLLCVPTGLWVWLPAWP